MARPEFWWLARRWRLCRLARQGRRLARGSNGRGRLRQGARPRALRQLRGRIDMSNSTRLWGIALTALLVPSIGFAQSAPAAPIPPAASAPVAPVPAAAPPAGASTPSAATQAAVDQRIRMLQSQLGITE